ncbi:MAG: FAD:protein FMN transferase [Candidatus Aminicenantes bacterium]|nr:MAG: FAD:protein FMN transferase [Candidatus Aminicenantes bacterium]
MSKKTLLLPVIFLLCVSCRQVSEKWQTATFLFFDTVCEINLFCSPSEFESAKKEIKEIFQDIEALFSPGAEAYSSVSVITLYLRALAIYHDSEGCFDITVAPLSRIWGFREHSHRVPSSEEINRALEKIGMDKITLTSEELILMPGMELDWGGIAKGFGIDLASQAMIKKGVKNGFINAGGDLYCWGTNPDQQSWRIGIKHPRDKGVSAILSIADTGAATTGDYQRFFIQEGTRYHHVFNPKSGYPSEGKQSVTVVGPETLVCDALSTALFVSDQPERIIKKFSDYGAIIIDSEGTFFLIGKAFPIRLKE